MSNYSLGYRYKLQTAESNLRNNQILVIQQSTIVSKPPSSAQRTQVQPSPCATPPHRHACPTPLPHQNRHPHAPVACHLSCTRSLTLTNPLHTLHAQTPRPLHISSISQSPTRVKFRAPPSIDKRVGAYSTHTYIRIRGSSTQLSSCRSSRFCSTGWGEGGGFVWGKTELMSGRVRTLTGKEIELDIEADYKVCGGSVCLGVACGVGGFRGRGKEEVG